MKMLLYHSIENQLENGIKKLIKDMLNTNKNIKGDMTLQFKYQRKMINIKNKVAFQINIKRANNQYQSGSGWALKPCTVLILK